MWKDGLLPPNSLVFAICAAESVRVPASIHGGAGGSCQAERKPAAHPPRRAATLSENGRNHFAFLLLLLVLHLKRGQCDKRRSPRPQTSGEEKQLDLGSEDIGSAEKKSAQKTQVAPMAEVSRLEEKKNKKKNRRCAAAHLRPHQRQLKLPLCNELRSLPKKLSADRRRAEVGAPERLTDASAAHVRRSLLWFWSDGVLFAQEGQS